MLFSVLVANYNNGKYFKDLYFSILQQSYTNWEVIIVDDMSTDDSVEIINKLIEKDKRFKMFSNDKNYGCGYTKRRCVELANGAICGFVDPDDSVTEDALLLSVNAHEANKSAALVHSRFNYCDENLNKISVYQVAGPVETNPQFTNMEGKVNHFSTFKRNFYAQTEGINYLLQRAVDQDLYLKLSETGSFVFIDKPLYNYRIHKGGISTFGNVDKAFYWFLKVIMKAEERRNTNLEDQVAAYLNRTNPSLLENNLSNPRYLFIKAKESFGKKPIAFLKKLFLNK